jgi:hypothetical protein
MADNIDLTNFSEAELIQELPASVLILGGSSGGFQPAQVGRALTYFVDAERDPIPAGCVVDWEKAKADLTLGLQQWEQSHRGKRRP